MYHEDVKICEFLGIELLSQKGRRMLYFGFKDRCFQTQMSQIAYFISHRYINLLTLMTNYMTTNITSIFLINLSCNLHEAIFSEFIDFEKSAEKEHSITFHIDNSCNFHDDFSPSSFIS